MGCNLYHPSLIWAPSFLKLSGSDSMPLHMSTYFFGAEAEGLQVPWRWENHDLEMNIAYVMKPPISHCHIALFLLCSIQYYTTPTFCLLIHIFVGQTFESTSFRQCPATMAWPCFSLHAGLPLAKKKSKKTIQIRVQSKGHSNRQVFLNGPWKSLKITSCRPGNSWRASSAPSPGSLDAWPTVQSLGTGTADPVDLVPSVKYGERLSRILGQIFNGNTQRVTFCYGTSPFLIGKSI